MPRARAADWLSAIVSLTMAVSLSFTDTKPDGIRSRLNDIAFPARIFCIISKTTGSSAAEDASEA